MHRICFHFFIRYRWTWRTCVVFDRISNENVEPMDTHTHIHTHTQKAFWIDDWMRTETMKRRRRRSRRWWTRPTPRSCRRPTAARTASRSDRRCAGPSCCGPKPSTTPSSSDTSTVTTTATTSSESLTKKKTHEKKINRRCFVSKNIWPNKRSSDNYIQRKPFYWVRPGKKVKVGTFGWNPVKTGIISK